MACASVYTLVYTCLSLFSGAAHAESAVFHDNEMVTASVLSAMNTNTQVTPIFKTINGSYGGNNVELHSATGSFGSIIGINQNTAVGANTQQAITVSMTINGLTLPH